MSARWKKCFSTLTNEAASVRPCRAARCSVIAKRSGGFTLEGKHGEVGVFFPSLNLVGNLDASFHSNVRFTCSRGQTGQGQREVLVELMPIGSLVEPNSF